MPKRQRHYSIFSPPSLAMSELVKTTLDHDSTDMLIEKWLEHRSSAHDAYHEWFRDIRERQLHHRVSSHTRQIIAWNKGEFVPENIFCRTVDTGRLIPLDRTWTTHVYHHHTMSERKLSMLPVVFTMLPELMLLRGMHDTGCDEVYIIVTDLKRQEMDDVTEYFKLVCRYCFGCPCKPSIERRIQYEHMRLSHTLLRQRRTPCFPQIDLTLRAILYEKRPRFLVLFSHQTTSYSQIFFTHPSYVPDEEIFYDYPTGCPNPCCTDDCEMIRFPRRGLSTAPVLQIKLQTKNGKRRGIKVKSKEMCNWIDCDVCFGETVISSSSSGSDSNSSSGGSHSSCSDGSDDGTSSVSTTKKVNFGQVCSKCKLVKYCSPEHQRMDWEEHKRVCVRN
ncbi:hypothetical protein CC1G_03380 [Coprinopsis cinerea okayama7|uniref:MYND-type domain-containing protein n=1 Tax=Coprinopsis cinerea (strain Okayama-7 / 130 / ATCC MYA-4618 / FGSC 9003) TaxID=240176 RepID=A8NR13_COPC7|nr:hypothetical protein CC1G_03380 [Coprinopsis cinerea okayama7\|eukprot:XP_001835598.2 hypothetical protein CC1G_03380 [Coprinopsis cinerea okayama7\